MKGRFWRKTLSVCLALLMVAALIPAQLIASVGATTSNTAYIYRWWDSVSQQVKSETRYADANHLQDYDDGLDDLYSGWYYSSGYKVFDDRVTIHGTVNIIICEEGGSYVKFNDGIHVSPGNTLNIYGQGNETQGLEAFAETNDYAGIGGNGSEDCGDINIYGGVVNAKADVDAAGIGGGFKGYGGHINIYGGKVDATGGSTNTNGGAGIGGGGQGWGGYIKIYGGDVTARGGANAAGIGGGDDGTSGDVEIFGGTVHAYGGSENYDGGAGIGGGDAKAVNNIVIYGGDVTAQGGCDAAGIGSGDYDGGGAYGDGYGNITIVGGTVTATGGKYGAGIGGGQGGIAGTIKISGGTVTATGGEDGAGIGSGEKAENSQDGTITINNGTVIAQGGKHGAGIGGGKEDKSGSIVINGGNVTATAGNSGAGIGTGFDCKNELDNVNITINGGVVKAKGGDPTLASFGRDETEGCGIGAGGFKSYVSYFSGTIKITGGEIEAIGGGEILTVYASPGIGGDFYFKNDKVIISGGKITAIGGQAGISSTHQEFDDSSQGLHLKIGKSLDSLTSVSKDKRSDGQSWDHVHVIEPCEHLNHRYAQNDDSTHYIECENCNHGDKLPEKHLPTETEWAWNDTERTAILHVKCICGFETDVAANVRFESISGAPCTGAGTVVAVAEVTYNGEGFSASKVYSVNAIGHSYREPIWIWESDKSAATATFICSTCGDYQTLDATITKNDNIITASVVFNGETYTDSVNAIGHTYKEPIWIWESDNSAATATFFCSTCDDYQTLDATITKNDNILTASVVFNGETYTDTKIGYADDLGARVVGHSLSLDGDIGINFYMELPDAVAKSDTAKMHFTIPKNGDPDTKDIKVSEAIQVEMGGKTYYVFKCQVAAKEMTSNITAQIIDGEKHGEIYTYSVKEYADYLIAHAEENAEWVKAVPLVKAMLNYGAYSQVHFDKNSGNLANAGLTEEEKTLGEVSIEVADYDVSNLPEGTTYAGATLSLKTETTLSLYFKSSDTLTFSCGSYKVDTVKSNGYQIARIRGIKAKHIGDVFTLNVSGTTVTYSPLNYCKEMIADSETDGNLKNALKALYLYWQAADGYFE